MSIVEEIIETTLRYRGYSPTNFDVMLLARGIDSSEKEKCVHSIENRLKKYPLKCGGANDSE